MKTTENYGLKKPEATGFYDVDDFNYNADVTDANLKSIYDMVQAAEENIESHKKDITNPHNVSKTQIGLGNVPNVSTNNQTPTYSVTGELAKMASGEKLTVAFGKIADAVSNLINHISTSATTSVKGHVMLEDSVTSTSVKTAAVPASVKMAYDKAEKALPKTSVSRNGTIKEEGKFALDAVEKNASLSGTMANQINLLNESLNNILKNVYPIGSIYMSVSSTNPSALFGGTWIAWGAGRVPVGVSTADADFNAAEKAGGAKTHTLTTAQLPSHTHTVPAHAHSIGSHTHTFSGVGHHHTPNRTGYCFTINKTEGSDSVARRRVKLDSSSGAFALTSYEPASDYTADDIHQATGTTDTVATGTIGSGGGGNTGNSSALTTSANGSGSAVNNVPPYITCYMWKRTA